LLSVNIASTPWIGHRGSPTSTLYKLRTTTVRNYFNRLFQLLTPLKDAIQEDSYDAPATNRWGR